MELPLLSLIVFFPTLAALLLALVPKGNEDLVRGGALVAAVFEFGLSLVLWFRFPAEAGTALLFVEKYAWIEAFRINYHLGVDGIALPMILLTGLLTPMTVLCSWNAIQKQPKGFFISLLLLETGIMGVFSAADLFLFYVFWEVMLIPMALLIGVWGGENRIHASVKFVLYTLVGSLLMLIAVIFSALQAGTFDVFALQARLPELGLTAQTLLFLAFSLSFAIKVPMFPFHTWLPDAHVQAPTAGSVILAGVLLKMGSYGFLRFAIPFYPDAAVALSTPILALSAIGIVFGSLMSLAQSDIKKLIAYSSVAHLGYVMLGLFSGSVLAAQGGVMQMVNHGVSTGALFLLVGVIYERAHTRGLDDFGGLAKSMPIYAVLFMIATLSSIGLPGTNGFVGEFLVLLGTFQTHPVFAAIGGLGVILGAAYMLKLYRNVFFGPENPKWKDLPEPTAMEHVTLIPLMALIFVLGLAPNLLLGVTEAPVARVVKMMTDSEIGRAP